MKLSSRERVLLIILGIIGLLASSYFLLFKPQMERIAALVLDDARIRGEIQLLEMEFASEAKLDTDIKELEAKIAEKTRVFFPALLEDKIIVMLDELIKKSGIASDTNSFSPVTVTGIQWSTGAEAVTGEYAIKSLADSYNSPSGVSPEAGSDSTSAPAGENAGTTDGEQDNEVESMSVMLSVKGVYSRWDAFIKELEDLDRTIIIKSLGMDADSTGMITGNIQVDFIALPKILEQDRDYFTWPYNGQYGKSDPFSR